MHDEAYMRELMSKTLGIEAGYILGAHNQMYPVVLPETGKTVHLIGFQGNLRGRERLKWANKLYGGAMYAIRYSDQKYTVNEVNGRYSPGKTPLVSPRAFARSPFGDSLFFIGGHDASGIPSDGMAWVFKAPLDEVLKINKERVNEN